jgi:hypothetical protein
MCVLASANALVAANRVNCQRARLVERLIRNQQVARIPHWCTPKLALRSI